MFQHYLMLGIFLLSFNVYSQQCAVNKIINIPDNGKSYHVSIEANTTQSGNRILCGVRLSFEHQFVDEMNFVLVSPSGKQVTLIAGKPASSKTAKSSWNVLFVRPGDNPHPDDFKKPVWKDNKWGEDQQYVGSYYPDDANGLDYFDGDNLIGTWNLIYLDKVKGGTGVLKNFQLIFCEPPRFCNPCQISREFMNHSDFGSFCGGDPDLSQIQPSVKLSEIASGFEYTFMVLNAKSKVVSSGRNPDLSQLSMGTYRIIGVQYRPENSQLLSSINDLDDLSDLFYNNLSNICGSYSGESSSFTILSNPGVRDEVLDVYGRDHILIDGQTITTDQIVMQSFKDKNGCDSLVRTHVKFLGYGPKFTQSSVYNCENPSIQISVSTDPEFAIDRWFTRDGKINNKSNIKSKQITVDAPGTYFVIFEIEDYLDTIEYILNTDPNTPVITLSNEYTLCSSIPLDLFIGLNFDEASVKPDSKATIQGNKLIIRKPDLYTVTARKGTCELIKHILVRPPESGETVFIEDDVLSCPESPVTLIPTLTRDYENYSWSFQGKEISSSKTLSTKNPGLYSFRAYDGNQCGITGTTWVENNVSPINLQILGPSIINCENENNDNRLTASFEGEYEAVWTLPDGSTVTSLEVPVVQNGSYLVKITDDIGCTFSASHNVSTSKKIVDFDVPGEVIIPCNSTSTTITAIFNASPDEYDITWNGASKNNPKNTATVYSPGIVKVTITHKESQCTLSKTINVKSELNKPELVFNSELVRDITCTDQVRIIPITINNCMPCTPVLTKRTDITLRNGQLIANEPGTVDILLDNGTCVTNQTITFPDKTKAKKLSLNLENIGCSGKEGLLEIKNKNDYSSIVIQTNQAIFSYSEPITNIASPTTYTIIYTDKSNGCQGQEDISILSANSPPEVEYESIQYLECSTGKVILRVKGDDITRILWFDPMGNEIGQETKELEVNSPGVYRFVVYNKDDCFQDLTIDVKDDRSTPSIDLDPEYLLPCEADNSGITPAYDTTNLDSVIWYGTGGWSSTQFFPLLQTGEYRVLIIGKNGCTSSAKTSVIQRTAGEAPVVIAPPITCISTFSRVYISDYSEIDQVQWIDESGNVSLLDSFDVYNPGLISLTVRKNNGCLVSTSQTVTEDKATVPFKINEPVINCHDLHPQFKTEITSPVDRPVLYQWYFGDTPIGQESTLDVDYPGDYRVEVSFDNRCVDSASHTVNMDTLSVNFNLPTDTISCARSKIQLRTEVGTDQISKATWSGPLDFTSTAIRPNFQIPGNYQVSYVGKNGCKGNSSMKIFGDIEPPVVDSVGYLSLGCGDKKVDLTYYSQDSVTTQYWQLPSGEILEDSVIQITNRGNYLLYLEGDNGCEKIDTFTINNPVNPKFELMISDADCIDHTGNALLLPDLDTFYAIWQDPSTMNEVARGMQSPELPAGSYLVTVINPYNDCDSTTTFEIKDIANILEAQITIDDSLRCERSQANLISSVYPPSENYTYEWFYGGQTAPISQDSMAIGISQEGMYSLKATDTVNQCIAQAKYENVRAHSKLRSFNLFLTEPACDINKAGFAIIDSIYGASDMDLVTYSLNQGPYINRDTFPFLYANQSYDVSAKDQYGCILDTLLLPELRGIMDPIGRIQDTTINSGDNLNFNDPAFKISYTSTDAPMSEKYTWVLNPDTLTCDYDCTEKIQKQLFQSRTVTAHLTNEYGCKLSNSFQVYVREGDILEVPNVIAPTSSIPANAHACIYTNEYINEIELFVVFNRLGKVIFKRSGFEPKNPHQNLTNCWNGRDPNNNIYPPDNYNYYVRYKTIYGDTKERYGNILLIR